ncbi:MAG: zf-TFIIB domain-containing protein [Polyangiaceae bacterium]|nr:zf-TFIIB domain-containing protein [Polyangiaceae bacterium]
MTLGSAPTGYRNGPLRCPACGAAMSERLAAVATVDVCGDCGGVFVDWFDGEVSTAVLGADPPVPLALRGQGDGNCPLCRTPMTEATYPDEGGARVARCGGCAGTFVPRDSMDAIVALGAPEDAPSEASLLDQLLGRLRSLFGW